MTKEIEVIVGPMNSGKTTELIRILNREKIAWRPVVCFKPAIDNRENEQVIVFKDGTQIDAFVVEGSQGLKTQVEALKKRNWRRISRPWKRITFYKAKKYKIWIW